jgi:hypothetical protein
MPTVLKKAFNRIWPQRQHARPLKRAQSRIALNPSADRGCVFVPVGAPILEHEREILPLNQTVAVFGPVQLTRHICPEP